MLYNVNTLDLLEFDISANQYIALLLLHDRHYHTFIKLLENGQLCVERDLEELKNLGFIISWDSPFDPASIIIRRDKVNMLLGLDDSYFWEFFDEFPTTVPNGKGGVRILRAVSRDAKRTLEAKKKYDKIVQNDRAKHKHILTCLKIEKIVRKTSGQEPYMNNLITWLNQQKWEEYEYLMDRYSKTINATKYGEDLG